MLFTAVHNVCLFGAIITMVCGIPLTDENYGQILLKNMDEMNDIASIDDDHKDGNTKSNQRHARADVNPGLFETSDTGRFKTAINDLDSHLRSPDSTDSLSNLLYVKQLLNEAMAVPKQDGANSHSNMEFPERRYPDTFELQQKRMGSNAYRLLFRILSNKKPRHSEKNQRLQFPAVKAIRKRFRYDSSCDLTKLTVQTVIEYLTRKTVCGIKAPNMRFGLGKR